MIKTIITNGRGEIRNAMVDDQNGLVVSQCTSPPLIPQKQIVFKQYLTLDGTATGTSSMLVDGSVTNKKFYIKASMQGDIYISHLSFIISDAGAILSKFGAITALTNGCLLQYTTSTQTVVIHNALKSNWDFVRLCLGYPTISPGPSSSAFIVENVVGTSEAIIPILRLVDIVPPLGIKLDMNTKQEISLTIRDNCSSIDGFDCVASGFLRLS